MPKFKSKLEAQAWAKLKPHFPNVKYEPEKIPFIQPVKERVYVPDFRTHSGKVYIEAKGKLDIATRQKMLWFRESNPDVKIVFLFQNPANKIRKGSPTTYAMWAESNGFDWLDYRKDWISAYKELCTE